MTTVKKLLEQLRERGLPAYGNKEELEERLKAHDNSLQSAPSAEKVKKKELQALLHERGLPVAGKKEELEERLKAHDNSSQSAPSTDKVTKKELQEQLRERGLPVAGKKEELEERLKAHDNSSQSAPSTEKVTKKELQEQLRERGLPVAGKMEELEERMKAHDHSAQSAPPPVKVTVKESQEQLCKNGLPASGKREKLEERQRMGDAEKGRASCKSAATPLSRVAIWEDINGRFQAELVQAIEHIAPAYGTGFHSGNLLLVSQKGSMVADKATLRKQVPNVLGNYMWTLTPPHGRKARAVYVGKAGGDGIKQTLKGRFEDYIHDKYFGPKTELFKQWAMVDAQSRAFKVEIRFRTDMESAKSAEESSLDQYDFALNDQKNGKVRWPIAFGQSIKQWEEYPVVNKELGELARALQVKLKIDGKI